MESLGQWIREGEAKVPAAAKQFCADKDADTFHINSAHRPMVRIALLMVMCWCKSLFKKKNISDQPSAISSLVPYLAQTQICQKLMADG
jgi:hypothetical protein